MSEASRKRSPEIISWRPSREDPPPFEAASPDRVALLEEYRASIFSSHQFRAARYHMNGKKSLAGDRFFLDAADVLAEKAILVGLTADLPYVGMAPGSRLLVETQISVSSVISRAVPFLWTSETWHQLESMRDAVPSHTVGDLRLGSECAYWTLQDEAITTTVPTMPNKRFHISHFLLEEIEQGLLYYAIGSTANGEELVNIGGVIKNGSVFPDDYEDGIARRLLGTILVGLAFLESRYIPKSIRRADRAARRRLGLVRANDQEVTFVDLRSATNHLSDGPDYSETPGIGRDYSCRWIVRGHWRQQWYPSIKCHKLIYVPPHIKGPEDKPLKQTVYRVVR